MIKITHVFDPYSPNIFEIGGISIAWYAVLILTGALIGLGIAVYSAKKINLETKYLYDGFVYGFIIGILGARLYYCLFNLDIYLKDPLSIFFIFEGGLAIHGGVIAASIFMYFYCKKHKLNIFKLVEIVFPSILLAQVLGRWGNFMNQEAFGSVINTSADQGKLFLSETLHLPDFIVNQMYLYGPDGLNYYHPTFLYESVLNLIGFLIVFFLLRKLKKYHVGDALLFYLVWYGVVRFFIESLRTDALMLGSIRIAQLVSILMIIVGIAIKIIKDKKQIYPLSYKDSLEGKDLPYKVVGLTNMTSEEIINLDKEKND